jgi:ribosomal peptide maturation radical SAM protein 1
MKDKTVEHIRGVSYWNDGKVKSNNQALPVTNLNDYPLIDYDEYFDEVDYIKYKYNLDIPLEALFFESARGCWWGEKHHCTFCGLNGLGMKFRSKSPERVIKELVNLSSRHHVLDFAAVDNIIDLAYIRSLLPILRDMHLDMSFFYEVKANMSKEQIQLFGEAGVTQIQAGIESLSSHVLNLMQKGITGIQNIQTLKWCQEYRLEVMWNILYGFPGETEQDYEDMAKLIPNLIYLRPPNAPASKIELDRFSPYHFAPGMFGITDVKPAEDYVYAYPSNKVDYSKIAYSFEYKNNNIPKDPSYIIPINNLLYEWRSRYYNSSIDRRPILSYRRGVGFMKIDDTRRSMGLNYDLSSPVSDIYLYCDQIRSLQNILNFASKIGEDSESKVKSIIEELLALGIMIQEGGYYLSLAIPAAKSKEDSLGYISYTTQLIDVPYQNP